MTQQEMEYLQNAFKGFVEAQKSERYPMCGMDEYTMDYLTAALAYGWENWTCHLNMFQGCWLPWPTTESRIRPGT